MRLHRFYLANSNLSTGNTVEVSNVAHLHQWKNVFRYSVGDEVIVFNGTEDAEYRATFTTLEKNEAQLEIGERREVPGANRKVTLYMAAIKKEPFEWVIEKVTELGVSRIVPLISERTEAKNLNKERAEKIIIEATEQSGRCRVPTIEDFISLEVALEHARNPVVCDIGPETSSAKRFGNYSNEEVSIFIGPEGGWSPAERALFAAKKVPIISFGEKTLRAETAALVAAAFALLNPLEV